MTAILAQRRIAKPWGTNVLPACFAEQTADSPGQEGTGEIWFEPPAEFSDLLVKYIFTTDKLSVQVHPSDAQTLNSDMGRQGKEECWLVLQAEPDAKLGIGFAGAMDVAAIRAAALDGSIEQKLRWHSARVGDFFYIPANTVHAIGAGLTLIEVQQNSDITYRLFDYGRPRSLHLDEALSIVSGAPYDAGRFHKQIGTADEILVDGPLFVLEQVCGRPSQETAQRFTGKLLVIPREGELAVQGEAIVPGQCAWARSLSEIGFAPDSLCLLAGLSRSAAA